MTGRNLPGGWAAFCVLRQRPRPEPVRRHVNWRHGGRSQAFAAEMRELRWIRFVLFRSSRNVPDRLFIYPPRPLGWVGYTHGRVRVRLQGEQCAAAT